MRLILLFIGILIVKIFIETFQEAKKEFGPEIKDWFKHTKLGMWYTNKKNGVTILSEREYNKILKSGKVKMVIESKVE